MSTPPRCTPLHSVVIGAAFGSVNLHLRHDYLSRYLRHPTLDKILHLVCEPQRPRYLPSVNTLTSGAFLWGKRRCRLSRFWRIACPSLSAVGQEKFRVCAPGAGLEILLVRCSNHFPLKHNDEAMAAKPNGVTQVKFCESLFPRLIRSTIIF